jgi:hypothetical protein
MVAGNAAREVLELYTTLHASNTRETGARDVRGASCGISTPGTLMPPHSPKHEQHRRRRSRRTIWMILLAVGCSENQAAAGSPTEYEAAPISARMPLDLVIALDLSASAFLPSGVDVDGDGIVGRITRQSAGASRPSTSDSGDTVFEAARTGARHVLEALSGSSARVGLITFAEAWSEPGRRAPKDPADPFRRIRHASLASSRGRGGRERRRAQRRAPWHLHLCGRDRAKRSR